MAIKQINMDFAGRSGIYPRLGSMVSTDDYDTITTAGYLNNSPSTVGMSFFNSDFLFAAFDDGSGGTEVGMFKLAIASNGTITLEKPSVNEPEYVQDITPGTSEASKALVLDASSEIDGVAIADIETAGTWVDGVTLGTPAASKVLTLNGSSQLSGVAIGNITAAGTLYSNLTATAADLNENTNQLADVSTVSTTPASGTCEAQFQFVDADAANLAAVTPALCFISTSAGVIDSAVTGLAVATNGALSELVTGQVALVTCSATGTFGVTVTASAGSYYLTFVLANNKIAISDELVVNA